MSVYYRLVMYVEIVKFGPMGPHHLRHAQDRLRYAVPWRYASLHRTQDAMRPDFDTTLRCNSSEGRITRVSKPVLHLYWRCRMMRASKPSRFGSCRFRGEGEHHGTYEVRRHPFEIMRPLKYGAVLIQEPLTHAAEGAQEVS